MKAKIRAKAGITIRLAACLSIGGALAVALSGGLSALAEGRSKTIAQLETSQQTDSSQDPPAGETQGPNTAPADPDTTPDTGDTQAPAQQEDTQQTPGSSESNPPAGETQGPNTAPTVPQEETSGSDESQESQARTENIVFVSTAEGSPTGEIEGQSERFSQIVGSGRLLVNGDNQVTGYYFIVSGLSPSQTLPYHFHSAKSGSTSTSCEGDKALLEDEAAGAVITPLSDIAPLQTTASGLAIVGSATSPVQLPNPVAFEDIGYLNIHANPDPTSGIVCANVPLKPVMYMSSGQAGTPSPSPESMTEPSSEPSPMPSPESNQTPPTQGPNTAPVPPTMNN